MTKFNVDYSELQNTIYKKSYKLSEVKDQIEKVAFDIVRFKSEDKGADLWQVQSADDGDYIVALYDSTDENVKEANWDVQISKTASMVHISYKGEPLVKIASSKLGIPAEEVGSVKDYLPAKLAENKKLVNALLNQLTPLVKKEVLNKYPELA